MIPLEASIERSKGLALSPLNRWQNLHLDPLFCKSFSFSLGFEGAFTPLLELLFRSRRRARANFNDRTIGALYDRYIAAVDFTVIAIDFRQGPDYKHPCANEDIEEAIEYTLAKASTLGGDPMHIGLIGSSSGGHLALLTGITTKHSIDYVVALWPVSDPAYRYAYAKRVNRPRLVEAHHGYFTSIDDMHAVSIQKIIETGNWNQLPPILVVQPGEDANVPLEMTKELIQKYESAGRYLEYAFFPGEPHGFAHLPSPATDRCNALIVDFIKRHSNNYEI